jgi:hypothetical protein
MLFNPEFILEILVAIVSAGSVYAAIRSDLATLHERTKNTQQSTARAHVRIDEITGNHHQ